MSFPHDTYFGILLPCLNWQLLSLQTPNVVEHRHVAATRSPLRAGQKTLDSLSPCTDLIFVTWYCSERCCPTGINEPHSGDLGPWVTLSRSLNYSEPFSPVHLPNGNPSPCHAYLASFPENSNKVIYMKKHLENCKVLNKQNATTYQILFWYSNQSPGLLLIIHFHFICISWCSALEWPLAWSSLM